MKCCTTQSIKMKIYVHKATSYHSLQSPKNYQKASRIEAMDLRLAVLDNQLFLERLVVISHNLPLRS